MILYPMRNQASQGSSTTGGRDTRPVHLYCASIDETRHPATSLVIHFLLQNATHSAAAYVHLPLAQEKCFEITIRFGWIWAMPTTKKTHRSGNWAP